MMKQIRVTKLTSLKDKSIGLIGKEKAIPVFFTTRWGIHTFGLTFPIDVLVLDREMRVRAIKKEMKPNRFFVWNPKFCHVIELPAGEVEKLNIQLHEKIVI